MAGNVKSGTHEVEIDRLRRALAEKEQEIARLKDEHQAHSAQVEAAQRDETRTREALLSMLEDLEDSRRRIERARREWTAAFDAIRDPVFLHDKEFRILRANRAYAERAGLPVQEVIGKPYWQVFPKNSGPLSCCLRAAQKAEEEEEEEEEVSLATGEILRSRTFSLRDERGGYLYSVHILEDVTEKRRAETERHVLSEALRQSAAGLILLDVNLVFRYANPAACRLVGWAPGQLDGLPIATVVPESARRNMQVIIDAVNATGAWGGEVALLAKGGELIPTHLAAAAVRDEQGKTIAHVGSWLDLRAIKTAQQTLADSEEKFRGINTAAQDAVLMIDDDGKLTYWNPAAERILGYRADDVLGRELHPLIAPARYHAAHAKGWPMFRKTGAGPLIGKTLELEAVHKDGREIPIELSVSALKLKGRWNAVGTMRDIAERKQAEARLRQSEERFRGLVETSSDWIWEVDQNGVYTYVSPRVREVLGYDPEEVLGRTPFDLMPPEEAQRLAAVFQKIMSEHRPFSLLENTNRRKDGSLIVLETSGVPILEVDGTFRGFRGIDRDITERKRAEVALRSSNRALKTLSAANAALVQASDEPRLLDDVCRAVVEVGGYRMAWVGYVEGDDDHGVIPQAAAGIELAHLKSLHMTREEGEFGKGPTSRALRSGTEQVVQDIDRDPGFDPWRALARERDIRSAISLPLRSKDELFGVLSIYADVKNAFSEDEVRLLTELASDLAYGVATLRARSAHERLQEEHLRSAERLRESLTDTIRAIALTVEKRDPYTAGHQQKVAQLAVAIAAELGFEPERIEGVRLGALIHDIGKIYVPAEILNRPGKLTPPEFEMIKSHAQVGYDIIKDVKFPWPVGEMILQHHERLDGSGYPTGLKGEAIIPEARILAVADVVEAMGSHRPYRAAHGFAAALAEIRQHRGTRYDAAAVDACIRLFEDKGFVFE